jgi:DNA replication and repair protein RecF
VRIRALTLRPFRNFKQIDLPFEEDHVLIFGPNGRGKSNILEAISYLSIGKSVRGAKDNQAVPHGEEYFDIQARCHNGRHEQKLRIFYAKTSGKKAFCEETSLPRVSDVLGLFKTVHFSPEDVSLVLRFPAQRRRLLDILISQSSPQYLRDLQRYQRVLTQRNHLLRNWRKGGRGPKATDDLEPWTAQLAQLGGNLREKRLESLEEMRGSFADYYRRFAPEGEEATIEYRGAGTGRDGTQGEELLEKYRDRREQELQVGYTLYGPHRDDLVFTLNGQPADTFGSEGQLKTILIAWKMAEVRLLEEPEGKQPVLLLDDVFSELDRQRVEDFLEIIDEFDQVLVTTPQEPGATIGERFAEIRLPA